jgi:hypothetical protein
MRNTGSYGGIRRCLVVWMAVTILVSGVVLPMSEAQQSASTEVASEGSGTTCSGTLSSGGRWCDNGNGTVTDMTTGLIWLKNATCGGMKTWDEA